MCQGVNEAKRIGTFYPGGSEGESNPLIFFFFFVHYPIEKFKDPCQVERKIAQAKEVFERKNIDQ